MDKGESWHRKDETSDDLLHHEQTHLSIGEANAAIAQNKIRSITGSGTGNTRNEAITAALKDQTSQANEVLKKMGEINGKMQKRYDEETNHGLDKDKQDSWNRNFEKNVQAEWNR